MSNEIARTETINIVPVQGIFTEDHELITLIGPAGTPFSASSGGSFDNVAITDSTFDGGSIGQTTPVTTAVIDNVTLTTGTISTTPTASDDLVNKAYVDSAAQGLQLLQPAAVATTANITLSGLQTIDGYLTLVGDRVLVKDQSSAQYNGVYIAAIGAWSRSTDTNTYLELQNIYLFVTNGTVNAGTAWGTTNHGAGTIDVTPINWVQTQNTQIYTAGTGLTLAANQFSITNTGVTAATKGSASKTVTATVNAQGQLTSLTDQDIAIANTQVSGLGTMSTQAANNVAITGGAINGTTIGASAAAAVTGTTITATTFSGAGTGLTGTASGLSIGGNAATATSATSATSATTATNLAGGATGSVPYQASSGSTTLLAAGTNGQVLTLASGVPSWATPSTGTVTSVGGTGTVSGISLSGTVTTSGNLTLGGTLDLSTPPVIGGTTPAAITGTTVTANTKFVSPYFDAAGSAGGSLRTAAGAACLQWGAADAVNLTLDGPFNMNPANASISIAPTGTGTFTVNPATAGTINNMAIGGTTAAAGSFTTLAASSTISANGSVGTSGQLLTSAGAGSPATWTTVTGGVSITDDTTTNATRYPLFTSATTGNITTEYTSSTKFAFNPSTGALTATSLTPTNALGVTYGGTGVTTSTGSGSVVLSTSPTLVTPDLGTPASGNFSTGTFTWPTFNQNTSGTAAGLSATLAIASGGTNATSFTAKSGNVAGLVFYDGTKLTNDATVTDVGYDTSTNTVTTKNLSIGGSYTETVYTLGTSGSIALSPANGTIQTCAASGTVTFTDSLSAGQSIVLMLTGGVANTINWPTTTWVSSTGNVAPTLTASSTIVFWKISTTLYGSFVGSYA